jgi:hypothetical protein
MTNLTPFQEKVKAVLIKLQYLCDSTASYKPDTKKGIAYSFKDMYPPLKGEEQLQDVVQHLSENGLKISITFPIYNSDPREPMYKQYGDSENVPLGLIKGKNIEEIKEVIQKNINKLSLETQSLKENDENSKVKKLKPKFTQRIKINSDSISWGDEKIPFESGQKTMVKLFIENGKEYVDKKLTKKGESLDFDELVKACGYGDSSSGRNALRKCRSKIRRSRWPITIENTGKKRYQMVTQYNKK